MLYDSYKPYTNPIILRKYSSYHSYQYFTFNTNLDIITMSVYFIGVPSTFCNRETEGLVFHFRC